MKALVFIFSAFILFGFMYETQENKHISNENSALRFELKKFEQDTLIQSHVDAYIYDSIPVDNNDAEPYQ
jgi:hypothetical protein